MIASVVAVSFKVYVKVTCSCKEQFGSSFVQVRMESERLNDEGHLAWSVAELTVILIYFIGFVC